MNKKYIFKTFKRIFELVNILMIRNKVNNVIKL